MEDILPMLRRLGTHTLTPLLTLGAPPVFSKDLVNEISKEPLVTDRVVFPPPTYTRAHTDKHGRRVPQNIGHRGYKAAYPENTMLSFKKAVELGRVDALETDVHISRDKVVVLCHDPSLKRSYGVDRRVADCDWDFLSTLRTTAPPHEPMPQLRELLEYMAQPEQAHLWLLLDIKVSASRFILTQPRNDPEEIMRLMAEVAHSVAPAPGRPWRERLLLGCWSSRFIPFAHEYLPDFSIAYIGWAGSYASKFLKIPNCAFNLLYATLVGPAGRTLLRKAHHQGRSVFAWTVNDAANMDWCVRHGVDGVITDNPVQLRHHLEHVAALARYHEHPALPFRWTAILAFVRINFFVWLIELLLRSHLKLNLDQRFLAAPAGEGGQDMHGQDEHSQDEGSSHDHDHGHGYLDGA